MCDTHTHTQKKRFLLSRTAEAFIDEGQAQGWTLRS